MTRMKWIAAVVGVLASATVVAAKGKGILYPDWSKPSQGTYESPSAELGKKVDGSNVWSTTTISSAVDKPIKGKATTLVGEIVDFSCYLQVGKHGDKHRDCGQKCARNGQPIGLLTSDGTIYMLIDEEHNPRRDGLTTFRKQAIDHMAHVVTVHGTLTTVEGQRALFVQGPLSQ